MVPLSVRDPVVARDGADRYHGGRMSLERLRPWARIAILVMALALVACLIGPMDDADMMVRVAILCSLALIATALFCLVPIGRASAGWARIRILASPPPLIPRRARPPDLAALGVLLI